MSRKHRAGCSATFRRAGIRPLCARWRTDGWWSSTERASGRDGVLRRTSQPGGLEAHTKTVLDNTPYRDSKLEDAGTEEGSPVPSWPGDPTPTAAHVVVHPRSEGCTYDQVLGDVRQGNGDVSLAGIGETVTPNLHKLAREFVLLDNFYVNGDGAADGYNWSVAAIAPDYVQKLWPS